MPGKRIPQYEFVRQHANLWQRAPDNRRRRFRKTIRTNTRFARAAWLDPRYNMSLFAEQHAFRSHRDSAEMTAAVTESFANDYELRASQAFLHVSAQLLAPDDWCNLADVVFPIHFPPRIEHSAGRRRFQPLHKHIELLLGHHLN